MSEICKKRVARCWCLMLMLCSLSAGTAAQQPLPAPQTEGGSHRTRLILKDGSYQIVMSYRVEGSVVRFVSAERGGAQEEIPLALVDLDATRKYAARHAPQSDIESGQPGRPPAIDPELLKEEADRAAMTPEVAPNLLLDTEDSVLLLDTYQGTPELVPLTQTGGDLNKTTGHSVLRGMVNPMATSHQIVQIKGPRAAVQAHVDQPVLYLRVGDDTGPPSGGAPFVVDTHGSKADAPVVPSGGAAASRYVIVRADVRRDVRDLMSFQVSPRGGVRRQDDVIETTMETLPGGHWLKITPSESLVFGEYALMEVISDREVNLGVWDFGVHPTAPENRDALHPEERGPAVLERRPRE